MECRPRSKPRRERMQECKVSPTRGGLAVDWAIEPYGERLLKRALFPSKRLRIGICDSNEPKGLSRPVKNVPKLRPMSKTLLHCFWISTEKALQKGYPAVHLG